MIEVEGLTKRFHRPRRWRFSTPSEAAAERAAVDGISFQVAAGEFVGYAGPNGAGKSTTVKMMCGILTPARPASRGRCRAPRGQGRGARPG